MTPGARSAPIVLAAAGPAGAAAPAAQPRTDQGSVFLRTSLDWNTFLGGNYRDRGYSALVNQKGHLYVAGYSSVSWGGASSQPYDNAFAARLDLDGNLIWRFFFGGYDTDIAFGMSSGKDGNILVSGYSENEWGSPLRPFSGATSVFVAQLTPNYSSVWLPLIALY